MSKIVNSLSEDEYTLIRETKKSQTEGLDEDELIDLHTRIRRARNKYVKLYRRAGAGKVESKKSRAKGKSANERNAAKAEVFEDALARVSRRLAAEARKSAESLKQERLARARKINPSAPGDLETDGKVHTEGRARVDSARDSPGRKKFEASSIAAGARRQTKKDKR
ncbi:hypothetical protein [Rhodococcus sp. B50]|uniref:hypothetical protein n=1 Tax=Rhodococcus sp. B50 TaxID=2682847 RepID=UPI0019F13275|nr:hypothetical protein [Rhodococcus sp. B50]MBS9372295.1 hypothetical protein [Rhodococcus sp. B50]